MRLRNKVRVRVVTEYNRPVALILSRRVSTETLTMLYRLLPDWSELHTDLAARWGEGDVLGTREWAAEARRLYKSTPPGIDLWLL